MGMQFFKNLFYKTFKTQKTFKRFLTLTNYTSSTYNESYLIFSVVI